MRIALPPAASQTFGSLWYAHTYLGPEFGTAMRWDRDTTKPLPADPSVIPEFFGDTILVNGTVFPTVTVEQREYRVRMLNACNARFLNFSLVNSGHDGVGTRQL